MDSHLELRSTAPRHHFGAYQVDREVTARKVREASELFLGRWRNECPIDRRHSPPRKTVTLRHTFDRRPPNQHCLPPLPAHPHHLTSHLPSKPETQHPS